MSRNHFILHRGVRRPVALFATVVTSSVCYCSTTIAQSVASSAFITTNNVPSSHTTRRVAYCPYNSKKLFTLPWQQQRLYQQQQRNGMSTSSSSSSSLYDGSTNNQSLSNDDRDKISNENIFFIEVGFGNDSHGQSATKAAIRACRNAIEFNSIPSIKRLIPNGGYDALKLDVLLAIPPQYQHTLNLDEVRKVFPYGHVRFDIQDGGMIAPSGIAIEKLGDTNDDMVVVCASVTVGH